MSSEYERLLYEILPDVRRPSRYIGAEWNQSSKKTGEVSIALAYPDVYEIGMSNLGLQLLYNIINSQERFHCERVFAPWIDMEEEMQKKELPLLSLENKVPIKDSFDLFGFSLQYELTFTNVLKMLRLAGIPLRSANRDENYPLIIGGGPCAFNPEPMAPFFDLFLIGEAEAAILEILDTIDKEKQKRKSKPLREDVLKSLSRIEGVYVPAAGEVNGASRFSENGEQIKRIKRRVMAAIDEQIIPRTPVVPYMETIHDRCVIEVMRGCTRGCRFCQAGIVYRPTRERSVDTVVKAASEQIKATGYEDVSLSSLSTTDHSQIVEMLEAIANLSKSPGRSVSLPSMRTDQFSVEIAATIAKMKRTGLTFAPEAGTERLRRVINKGLTEYQILEATTKAFKMGWSRLKLYFMIGLPTETDDDLIGIAELLNKILSAARVELKGKNVGRIKLAVSVASFVPKPHTPFQWIKTLLPEEIERRQKLIRDNVKSKQIYLRWHDASVSVLEAALARGGRETADAIENAYKRGAGFDSWTERFAFETWKEAFSSAGMDICEKAVNVDEPLPWRHIDTGIDIDWLKREYELATSAVETEDCRDNPCSKCGVCHGNIGLEIADE